MLISIFVMILFYFVPELSQDVPDIKSLKILENFIRDNPTGTAIGMAIIFPGILILITIVSVISNYLFRKDIKNIYLVYPEQNVVKNTETDKTDAIRND